MSDLASPLLFVMRDEAEAFWCFVALIERMQAYFSHDCKCASSALICALATGTWHAAVVRRNDAWATFFFLTRAHAHAHTHLSATHPSPHTARVSTTRSGMHAQLLALRRLVTLLGPTHLFYKL